MATELHPPPPLPPAAAPRLRLCTRQRCGLLLVLAGTAAGLWTLYQQVVAPQPMVGRALVGGLIAALATALGTLPVALAQRTSDRSRDAMLGFGAGVMLAACSFSLLVPALHAARATSNAPWQAGVQVGAGLLLGAALLVALDRLLPHEHFLKGREGPQHAQRLRRTWLFVIAIVLHNLPEGLAIGVAQAGTDPVGAAALTTGIAIQDVPEGLVIAAALIGAGYRRAWAVTLGALSGLVEPLGAVAGAGVIVLSSALLPWGLAFAAGAMLFVISHEIIPESHRQGHEHVATTGLLLGFVLMMMLDTSLN